MTALAVRTGPARRLFWPAVAASLGLVLAGAGGVGPLLPFVALAGLAALLALPIRVTALTLLAAALLFDNPGERPMAGLWKSPLYSGGMLLYENLRHHTGIDALRFSALELMVGALVAIVLLRRWTGDPVDATGTVDGPPRPLRTAFILFFGAIVGLEVYGLARGGDFRNSLWQIRALFWLPVLGVLFGHAFATRGARLGVLRVLLAVAVVRALSGVYFYFVVLRRSGGHADYATTHSDSILTVVAMLVALAILVERPSRVHIALNLMCQPVFLLGLFVNNRRIALVALACGLAALVLMGPLGLKRRLARSVAVLLPVALLYTAVGWNATSRIFWPVRTLQSMGSSTDTSSQTRDIENFNLIRTLMQHPVLGSGFGHEYDEQVQADRVDQYFAQYRYIAHNSVLWLLSLAGVVGFTLVWSLFPVALLVARRAHALARHPIDRAVAFGAVAALICFIVQAWGDMGLQSWMGTLLLTGLTGATGALLAERERAGEFA